MTTWPKLLSKMIACSMATRIQMMTLSSTKSLNLYLSHAVKTGVEK